MHTLRIPYRLKLATKVYSKVRMLVSTKKASTRTFFWLKPPSSAFTMLNRH